MHTADTILFNIDQLVTLASQGQARRGPAMQELSIIQDGAVVILEGDILDCGPTEAILKQYQSANLMDCSGMAVIPGLVDPHTHAIYGGERIDEFEMRIQGHSYMDIMSAGGGINSTVKATRQASLSELVEKGKALLQRMLVLGTTTIEIKSGYGLTTDDELKMLMAMEELDLLLPVDIVPTFLGAHAIPPEYRDDPESYVQLILDEMIPYVATWYEQSRFKQQGVPLFIDVFCEQNAFTLEQSQRILEAGQRVGFKIKAHVDEFTSMGAVEMGLALGATSLDHLDVSTSEDLQRIAESDTLAVMIPTVNFNLGQTHFADARSFIDRGGALALTTDVNPGSAPCPSQVLVMAIATRYQRVLPSEALCACTLNAAHAIGMGERIGSIEAGKQADLVLLNVPDYRYLSYYFGDTPIQSVMKRGVFIS
ncbi:imidazolonepropionase [Anaerolineales bacterium]